MLIVVLLALLIGQPIVSPASASRFGESTEIGSATTTSTSVVVPPPDIVKWEVASFGSTYSLDPHINSDPFGEWVLFNVYETFYTYPWESGGTEPTIPLLAAASPTISADGKQYNITLRQNILFQDETPFNASCVKWNIERAVKQAVSDSPVWPVLELLAGGAIVKTEALAKGPTSPQYKAAFDDWVENSDAIVVPESHTIQFNLDHPFVPFTRVITAQACSIMSPSYAIAHASNAAWANWDSYAVDYGEVHTYMEDHTCGTGPYSALEWNPNESVHLSRSEDYWRRDAIESAIVTPIYAGEIEEVHIRVNSRSERKQSLIEGRIDGCYWPPEDANEIWDSGTLTSKDPDITTTSGFSFELEALTFRLNMINITRGGVLKEIQSPFIYRELRKCFAYAFDYDGAIYAIRAGWGLQPDGFIPLGMFGQTPSQWLESYDIDVAVSYWNTAMGLPGFVNAINSMEGYIDLYYEAGNTVQQQSCLVLKDGLAQVMANVLTDLSGIIVPEIRVNSLTKATYQERKNNGEMSIWHTAWAANYADPHDHTWAFAYSDGTFMSESGYANTTVDAWIEFASTEDNPTVRQTLYDRIQHEIAHGQPSIYIYQLTEFMVRRAWLEGSGLIYNPMHGHYWYHVHKTYDLKIEPASDYEYTAGTTGHSITWEASASNPESYQLFSNSTLIDSGPWNGLDVIIVLDGLPPGVYNFTIVLTDSNGYIVLDSVWVTVTEPSYAWWTSPEMLMVLATGGGLAILVLIVVLLRRRQN